MTTIEELQSKVEALTQAQQEADLLHETSRRLNEAKTETQLLAALTDPGLETPALWSALYRTQESDTPPDTAPAWSAVSSVWSAGGPPPLPAGMRFHVPQFPFSAVWAAQPTEPLLVADVLEDERFDDLSRNTLTQNKSRALAIIPLRHAGRWVGFISFSWETPHQFTPFHNRLYRAFANLAAPVVESQRLLAGQQDTVSNTLYTISSRLNTAADDEALLEILTQPSLEAGVALSTLAYIDADDAGRPQWAEIVSTWQQEGTRYTSNLIAAIRSQITAHGEKTNQPTQSDDVRYYLPEFPLADLWLASQQEPQLVADVNADFRLTDAQKKLLTNVGLHAVAIVPLASQGRWIGMINLFWDQPHPFNETEIGIYRAFTNLAAPAIATHRQLQALDQRQAQYSHTARQFQMLAGHSSEAMAIIDPSGRYLYANPACRQLLGHTTNAPSLTGRHLLDFLAEAVDAGVTPDTLTPELSDTLQTLTAGWSGQTEIVRHDERRFPAQLTTFILDDEQAQAAPHLGILLQDLTQPRQIESWVTLQRDLLHTLAQTENRDAALGHCLAVAIAAARLERGRLYLLDEDGDSLTLAAHHNHPDNMEEKAIAPLAQVAVESAAGQALRRETPIYADEDALTDNPALRAGDEQATAVAIVPVLVDDQFAGVLHLAATQQPLLPDFAPTPLETIAAFVGALLSRQQADTELNNVRSQSNAQLEIARTQLALTLQEHKTQADTGLRRLQEETARRFEQTTDHAQSQLQTAQTAAESAIQQLAATDQSALQQSQRTMQERVRTQQEHNQHKLAALREQGETALQTVRQTARTRLAQVETESQSQLADTRHHTLSALESVESTLGQALRTAQQRTEEHLQQTRTEAEAQLLALQGLSSSHLAQLRNHSNHTLQQLAADTDEQHHTLQTHLTERLDRQQNAATSQLDQLRAEAEASLRYSEARRRTLLENITTWAWRVDLNGRISHTNPAVEPLLGRAAADIIDQPLLSLVAPADQAALKTALANSTTPWEQTIAWQHTTGNPVICHTRLYPSYDLAGKLVGVNGVCHNLTTHSQAERWLDIRRRLIQQLATLPPLGEGLAYGLTAALEMLGLDRGRVYLLDAAARELTLIVQQGLPANLQAQTSRYNVQNPSPLVEQLLSPQPQYVTTESLAQQPELAAGDSALQSMALLPLKQGEAVVGVVHVGSTTLKTLPPFAPVPLETIAALLSATINNRHLYEAQTRATTEQAALQKRVIEVQEEVIQALPTPIIPMMGQIIAVPLIGKIDSIRVKNITQALLNGIKEQQAKIVMLDISGIPADTQTTTNVNNIIRAAKQQGVQTMVTGTPDALAGAIEN